MSARADAMRKFIAATPNDPFPRYGLAMELKNSGALDESHQAFLDLEERFPDYVPQYLMHAQLQAKRGTPDEVRQVLERGIAAARKKGDGHALGELEGMLASL